MFRRLPDSLPEDPRFKADMKAMGYFVNENSQIRKSKNPNEKFHYFITNNTRWNEMHREAMESCIRREVAKRSLAQGVGVLYLPQMTASDPKAPSVPIFLTPPHQLKQKKRVFVIVNGARQDLGQWAYRTTFGEGIVAGSCVSLLQELREREDVGMIIANSGQLLYSHKFNQAMTDRSWNARPRTSAVHPVVYADAKHNHVPDNEDVEAHFKFILDNLALNEEYVDKDAEVYVIGIESGGDAALKVLDTHCKLVLTRHRHRYIKIPPSVDSVFENTLAPYTQAHTTHRANLLPPHHSYRPRPTLLAPSRHHQPVFLSFSHTPRPRLACRHFPAQKRLRGYPCGT